MVSLRRQALIPSPSLGRELAKLELALALAQNQPEHQRDDEDHPDQEPDRGGDAQLDGDRRRLLSPATGHPSQSVLTGSATFHWHLVPALVAT
jgi:hypothetical protein